jgi:hypothetical protein
MQKKRGWVYFAALGTVITVSIVTGTLCALSLGGYVVIHTPVSYCDIYRMRITFIHDADAIREGFDFQLWPYETSEAWEISDAFTFQFFENPLHSRELYLMFPLWLPWVLASIWPTSVVYKWFTTQSYPDCCSHCGYNLRGSACSATCPECGKAVTGSVVSDV